MKTAMIIYFIAITAIIIIAWPKINSIMKGLEQDKIQQEVYLNNY